MSSNEMCTCWISSPVDSLTEAGIPRYSLLRSEDDDICRHHHQMALFYRIGGRIRPNLPNPSAANKERQYEGHCSFMCSEPPCRGTAVVKRTSDSALEQACD